MRTRIGCTLTVPTQEKLFHIDNSSAALVGMEQSDYVPAEQMVIETVKYFLSLEGKCLS